MTYLVLDFLAGTSKGSVDETSVFFLRSLLSLRVATAELTELADE
jgi:hypothetical protein